MGIVNIPANPSVPGHLSVQLHLDATEVKSISNLLRQVLSISRYASQVLASALPQLAADPTACTGDCRSPVQQATTEPHTNGPHVRIDQSQEILSPLKELSVSSLHAEQPSDQGRATSSEPASAATRDSPLPQQESPSSFPSPAQAPHQPPNSQRDSDQPEQNAWSKRREQVRPQQSILSDQNGSPHNSSQGWEQGASGFQQTSGQGSRAKPAKNSAQDWPPAQQSTGNTVTYGGGNAGSTQNGRTGGRNAGKQMASKGFVNPIQITRMDWGEPLPNAQDTWGDEEPAPQPLASAIPAAGRPSVRRPAAPSPAFPPMPDAQDVTPPLQQSSRLAEHSQLPATMHWHKLWTTDALDHVGDEVRACLHVTKMPDLQNENEGAGTEVSTWVCTPALMSHCITTTALARLAWDKIIYMG